MSTIASPQTTLSHQYFPHVPACFSSRHDITVNNRSRSVTPANHVLGQILLGSLSVCFHMCLHHVTSACDSVLMPAIYRKASQMTILV